MTENDRWRDAILQQIDAIRLRHEMELAPLYRQLCLAEALRPQPPILLTREQAANINADFAQSLRNRPAASDREVE